MLKLRQKIQIRCLFLKKKLIMVIVTSATNEIRQWSGQQSLNLHRMALQLHLNCINYNYIFMVKLQLTNRFHVAVRLFSNRSQMTSKCGKNKKVAHEAIAECVTDVLTTF